MDNFGYQNWGAEDSYDSSPNKHGKFGSQNKSGKSSAIKNLAMLVLKALELIDLVLRVIEHQLKKERKKYWNATKLLQKARKEMTVIDSNLIKILIKN